MPEAYKGSQSRAVGTSRTKAGAYTVPGATVGVVVGLAVANIQANRPVKATVELHDGTNYTLLRRQKTLEVGDALTLADFSNQIVLQSGASIFVTADTDASLDVALSVKEIS